MGSFGGGMSSGVSGFGSTGSTGGTGTTQKIDVFEPEQWDWWRKFISGSAYDPQILERYISGTIDPTYKKMEEAAVNQANNQYGATPSGYFSAATRLAKETAVKDVATAKAQALTSALMNFDQQKKTAQLEALKMSPKETIYEPAASSFDASGSGMYGSGGYNTVVGTPGAGSSYKPISSLEQMQNLWNPKPATKYTQENYYQPVTGSSAYGSLKDLYPSDEYISSRMYGTSF